MANENRKIDENYKASMSAVTNDASQEIRKVRVNPTTNRVLVEQSSLTAALDTVSIANSGGTIINPATKEGLDAIELNQTDGTHKTKIVDSSGNVVGAEEGFAGEYALRTHGTQNIQLSTNNTSLVDLAYNATFTGIGEETYGFSAIQVFFYTDQRCEVSIEQGSGILTYELTDTFTCHQSQAFTTTVISVAPYFRITVKNVSVNGQATSGLKLFTAMTPMLPAQPRKLSQRGNFMTAVDEWIGRFGHSVTVSPMGALRMAEATRLAGASFVGATVDTNFWTKGTPTGTADWSQTTNPGSLTLSTGTTANSSIIVNSQRIARYVAASPNYYRGNIRVPAQTTGTAGYITTIRFGAFDADNGYFFQLVQTNPLTTPVLSVVCRKTTVDTAVTSGSFNGDYNQYYALDTNCHTYEIYWTNKNAYFLIDDVLIHTVTGLTVGLVDTQSLKIGFSITNSGNNNANNNFVVRSSTINRLGREETRPQWKYQVGANTGQVLKYGPGSLHRVVCNKNTGTTITLYDALSAINPIGIIDPTSRDTIDYHLDFYTGLYLVTVGTAIDCTIVYE